MNTKICCRCGEERSVTEFRKDSSKKDKLRPECKICLKTSEMIFRNENPKEMGERLKKFYEKNPDKRKKYRERYRSRKQERKKERTETDPTYNLVNRMRCRLWKYLKIHKIYKNNSTFEIIGCTPSELKEHIEKQFIDDMNWDNKGNWHIDHIIPLSSAKTEVELMKLFHFSNLQPLWASDNIKKSNKIV
jgi:hypothetical protein